MAVAVAAIKALTEVVKLSQAHTMMGLEKDLKDAADSLIRWHFLLVQRICLTSLNRAEPCMLCSEI